MAFVGEYRLEDLLNLLKGEFATSDQVDQKILDALKDITGFQVKVVTELPATGQVGVFYLVPSTSSKVQNIYDEYIWVVDETSIELGKFEQVGSTAIELSWDSIANKPFISLDAETLEVNDGVLSVIGGAGGSIDFESLYTLYKDAGFIPYNVDLKSFEKILYASYHEFENDEVDLLNSLQRTKYGINYAKSEDIAGYSVKTIFGIYEGKIRASIYTANVAPQHGLLYFTTPFNLDKYRGIDFSSVQVGGNNTANADFYFMLGTTAGGSDLGTVSMKKTTHTNKYVSFYDYAQSGDVYLSIRYNDNEGQSSDTAVYDITKLKLLKSVELFQPRPANPFKLGLVKPDGTTIISDEDGTIRAVSAQGEAAHLTVEKQGTVAILTANDIDGITTVYVYDGANGNDGTDGKDGKDGITPTLAIDSLTKHWFINGIDSGMSAQGPKGDTGTFKVAGTYDTLDDLIYNQELYFDSDIVLVLDTHKMYLKMSSYVDPEGIHNGWVELGGFDRFETIRGDKGDPGDDGLTPMIDQNTYHWMIGTTDTGIDARGVAGQRGSDGYTPEIRLSFTLNSTTHDIYLNYDYTYMESGEVKHETSSYPVSNIPSISFERNSDNDGTVMWFNKNHWSSIPEFMPQHIDIPDGFSPKVSLTEVATGLVHLVIEDIDGEHEIDINQGYTPTITVTAKETPGLYDFAIDNLGVVEHIEINGGYAPTIDVTHPNDMLTHVDVDDKNGHKEFDLSSSTITVGPKNNNRVPITVNDGVNGLQTVTIFDGENAYDDTYVLDELDKRVVAVDGYSLVSDEDIAKIATIDILTGDETVDGSVDKKIADAVGGITGFNYKVVATLPNTGDKGTIYLVPSANPKTKNISDEYIYVDNKWEQLGSTQVDISGYVKNTDIATDADLGIVKVDNDTVVVAADGTLSVPKATDSQLGAVRADGTTITVDSDGVLHGAAEKGVSKDDGNIIATHDDGLYVPTPYFTSSDQTITASNGVASVQLSPQSGNAITTLTDGIYVPTANGTTAGVTRPDNTSLSVNTGTMSVKLGQKSVVETPYTKSMPLGSAYRFTNTFDEAISYTVTVTSGATEKISGSIYTSVIGASTMTLVTTTANQYSGTCKAGYQVRVELQENATAVVVINRKRYRDNLIASNSDGLMVDRYEHLATTLKPGLVIPDNNTITVDENGVITGRIGTNSVSKQARNLIQLLSDGIYVDEDETVPLATLEDEGRMKPDGTTLTVDNLGTESVIVSSASDNTLKVDTTNKGIYVPRLTYRDLYDITKSEGILPANLCLAGFKQAFTNFLEASYETYPTKVGSLCGSTAIKAFDENMTYTLSDRASVTETYIRMGYSTRKDKHSNSGRVIFSNPIRLSQVGKIVITTGGVGTNNNNDYCRLLLGTTLGGSQLGTIGFKWTTDQEIILHNYISYDDDTYLSLYYTASAGYEYGADKTFYYDIYKFDLYSSYNAHRLSVSKAEGNGIVMKDDGLYMDASGSSEIASSSVTYTPSKSGITYDNVQSALDGLFDSQETEPTEAEIQAAIAEDTF